MVQDLRYASVHYFKHKHKEAPSGLEPSTICKLDGQLTTNKIGICKIKVWDGHKMSSFIEPLSYMKLAGWPQLLGLERKCGNLRIMDNKNH